MRLAMLMTMSLALTVACAGYPDAVAADPAHYAVEYENDVARLLRVRYGPGEESVMHRHPPLCSVALSDAVWRMTDPDGEVTDQEPSSFGAVGCGTEGSVHLPSNPTATPNEVVLIELKEGAAPGTAEPSEYPDAVTADPDHYAVEWENDVVRVLRVVYGAGEESVMHSHPANCYVALGDGSFHVVAPSGAITSTETQVGQLVCADAMVHRPSNTGSERRFSAILIEFKNRETFAR